MQTHYCKSSEKKTGSFTPLLLTNPNPLALQAKSVINQAVRFESLNLQKNTETAIVNHYNFGLRPHEIEKMKIKQILI